MLQSWAALCKLVSARGLSVEGALIGGSNIVYRPSRLEGCYRMPIGLLHGAVFAGDTFEGPRAPSCAQGSPADPGLEGQG